MLSFSQIKRCIDVYTSAYIVMRVESIILNYFILISYNSKTSQLCLTNFGIL